MIRAPKVVHGPEPALPQLTAFSFGTINEVKFFPASARGNRVVLLFKDTKKRDRFAQPALLPNAIVLPHTSPV
jgi:hypothetical protein